MESEIWSCSLWFDVEREMGFTRPIFLRQEWIPLGHSTLIFRRKWSCAQLRRNSTATPCHGTEVVVDDEYQIFVLVKKEVITSVFTLNEAVVWYWFQNISIMFTTYNWLLQFREWTRLVKIKDSYMNSYESVWAGRYKFHNAETIIAVIILILWLQIYQTIKNSVFRCEYIFYF